MLGLIENTSHEFHTGPGVSCHDLRVLTEATPMHLMAKRQAAAASNGAKDDDNVLRAAVRCAVLEPDEFPYRYALMPEGIDRRSKVGRELFAETEAEGKTPLKPVDYDQVMGAASALRANKAIRYILGISGTVRHSIYWQDAETGVVCKYRPNFMIEPCATFPNGLILEFKPCDSARPESFREFASRAKYHMHAAFAPVGFQKIFGTAEAPAMLFAAYETKAPWANKVYPASASQIELGTYHVRNALALYAECERTGQWPGYDEELTPLELAPWDTKELQDIQAAAA